MKKGIQAEKRIRQNIKRRERNNAYKSLVKGTFKHATRALEGEKPEAETAELIKTAVKAVDKAAQKGVVHKKTAARKKSRLMKKYNRLTKKEEA
ncbi:MAG: 30S ribosomal protein S20 [Chloroflexi bacterium]|nr:30S ribosomal protein S20 [Chloroflexota bacterium]